MISFKELKQRLFHPYYIIHFIYGSCYVVIRLIQLWKTQSINLQETEAKAFLLLTFLIIWKCIISISAEELSSVIILYTKFFTLCSLFWRIGFWTSFFYIVGWIALV
ncbi:hypothetical protein RMCBS344292_00285 [Rhizopus microsporus]|nr:hypothetical protein RMCBS344292_00285 [Rhizopus microsporus]